MFPATYFIGEFLQRVSASLNFRGNGFFNLNDNPKFVGHKTMNEFKNQVSTQSRGGSVEMVSERTTFLISVDAKFLC